MGTLRLNEEAVFRWVVIVTLAAVTIVGVTLLLGSLVGALWGLVLVCAAAVHGWRWVRERRGARRR